MDLLRQLSDQHRIILLRQPIHYPRQIKSRDQGGSIRVVVADDTRETEEVEPDHCFSVAVERFG